MLANTDRTGIVLAFDGPNMNREIEASSCLLEDLGLDDAPEGLSIWEGRVIYSGGPGYFGDDEGDVELRGTFRRMTSEEWRRLEMTGVPWEFDVENDTTDPLVTVCANCRQASCWYAEFMCDESKTADVVEVRRSQLVKEAREHPHYWTDEAIANGGTYKRVHFPID